MSKIHQIIRYYLGRTYYEISISGNTKAINKKFEQNKAQCSLYKETVKISSLSSGNVSKYNFLTGKDVLPEKEKDSEKATALKRFEFPLLGKELKAQTSAAEKQFQKLDKVF